MQLFADVWVLKVMLELDNVILVPFNLNVVSTEGSASINNLHRRLVHTMVIAFFSGMCHFTYSYSPSSDAFLFSFLSMKSLNNRRMHSNVCSVSVYWATILSNSE